MAEYISKKKVLDYLNGYLHSLGYDNTDLIVNGQRHALINVLEDILTVKAADVQPVEIGKYTNVIKALDMRVSYLSNIYRNVEEEREMVAIMVAVEVLTKLNGGEQE